MFYFKLTFNCIYMYMINTKIYYTLIENHNIMINNRFNKYN